MRQYDQIFSKIHKELKYTQKPIMVGISGAYTSGKTIFTLCLSKYLISQGVHTQILHYDDFHRPLNSLIWEPKDSASEVDTFYNKAFDTQKLVDEVLVPLTKKNHLKKVIKGLNWETGLYDKDILVEINQATIVLVEGVLLFRSETASFFDYKIFLEVNEKTILDRGKARDVPRVGLWILEKYHTRYIPVHRRYLSEDKPQCIAELLIDNNDFTKPKII